MSNSNKTLKPTEAIARAMGLQYIYDEWGRVNLYADKLPIGSSEPTYRRAQKAMPTVLPLWERPPNCP